MANDQHGWNLPPGRHVVGNDMTQAWPKPFVPLITPRHLTEKGWVVGNWLAAIAARDFAMGRAFTPKTDSLF